MTRFEEIQEAGRQLSPADLKVQLESIERDPRFAAVVETVRQLREHWVELGSSERVADSLGKQARFNGGVAALDLLMSRFQTIANPKAKPATREPEG